MRNVAAIGLGPVGLATAWDLLRRGHRVWAFDVDIALTNRLRHGDFSPHGALAKDLAVFLKSGAFQIVSSLQEMPKADAVVVCVGTPLDEHRGTLNTTYLVDAIRSVRELPMSQKYLILRSTLEPGTIRDQIVPELASDFQLSYYPEFLRELHVIEDVLQPPLKVAAHSSSIAEEMFVDLFPEISINTNDFTVVETLKIACNAFHALKVTFANEMAAVCEAVGASPEEMMDYFCQDTKLNLSALYLKPGKAFGGRCLDKDVRALEHLINEKKLTAPVLMSIRNSNDGHKDR